MIPLAPRMRMALAVALVTGLISGCRARGGATPAVEVTAPSVEATAGDVAPEDTPPTTPYASATSEPDIDADASAAPAITSACDAARGDVFREGLIGPAQGILDGLPGATVYEIDLEIAADLLSLRGHEEVCYTNREDVALDEAVFRLFPNLLGGTATVSDLRVAGEPVSPRLELADSALWVPLGAPLQPGESVTIEMDFQVDLAREMAGNYGLFGYFDDVLSLHEVYPVIPVYDDEGWNVELPPPRGDITYYDAAFYTVRVTAPADLVLASSGVKVERQEGAESQTITFAAGPARGFYLAASPDYTVVSGRVGETAVNSYALAGHEEAAALALEVATGALESYSARFGTYPYTEFDVVSTAMQALGMEYPGIVAITSQVYDFDAEVRGLPASVMLESTLGHEVAHQWFYNVVGNDQIDEPWLDEAVVQYVTGLYYLDAYGAAGYEGWRESWYDRWDGADRAEIPVGLPVREYESGTYGAIVYGRGPLFVEALAEEMGQERFDAFLRDYYQSQAWDIGTPEVFRQLAEEHCRCDLGELFAGWVYADDASVAPLDSDEAVESGPVAGWAVLAEKDDYDDVDMTNLPVGYIGIEQMGQVLEEAGWDSDRIRVLRDFDGNSLRDGLDWLEVSAGKHDVVLVYVNAHGRFLTDVLEWDAFFADEWEDIPSQRRILVVEACQAGSHTAAVAGDPAPYISIAGVAGDEAGWSGLEEEGLPIIGGVFTHYFAAAFGDSNADTDRDGCVSVQEAAVQAEQEQRTYMHEVVFAVPEFLEMYRRGGATPDEDPTFPDVVIDDRIGEPLCLELTGDD